MEESFSILTANKIFHVTESLKVGTFLRHSVYTNVDKYFTRFYNIVLSYVFLSYFA